MFYNWYDPAHRREAAHLARERQRRQAVPLQRRQRLARHRAAARRARRAVAGRRRPTRSATTWTSAATTTRPSAPGGQIRGGFWDEDPHDAAAVKGDYCGMGPDVWYTGHHYGAFNTEPRMASYLGIAVRPDPGASTTSAPTAPSRTTTATGPGPRPSRSASGRPTDGDPGLRGRAALPRHERSSRPGAAACSRR